VVAKTGLQIYKIKYLFCNFFQPFLGHSPGFSSHIPIRKVINVPNPLQNVPGITIEHYHFPIRHPDDDFHPREPPFVFQINSKIRIQNQLIATGPEIVIQVGCIFPGPFPAPSFGLFFDLDNKLISAGLFYIQVDSAVVGICIFQEIPLLIQIKYRFIIQVFLLRFIDCDYKCIGSNQ
jgi:hypothetical protein